MAYTETIVDLSKGEQHAAAYAAKNPQSLLPTFEHDGLRLVQSLPILEYIDETWPEVPLMPTDRTGRARVRALAQTHIADTHPLIVPRVREWLEHEFHVAEAERLRWIRHWFQRGSAAIEAALLAGPAGAFADGDHVTVADLALASHVVGSRMFQADLSAAPTLVAAAERTLALPAVARAHPLAQPGAPASV